MKIELSGEQINNLVVFMDRVKLDGREAFVWVELYQKLQQAMYEFNNPKEKENN